MVADGCGARIPRSYWGFALDPRSRLGRRSRGRVSNEPHWDDGGLEVAMDDAGGMSIGEALGDLGQQGLRFRPVIRAVAVSRSRSDGPSTYSRARYGVPSRTP